MPKHTAGKLIVLFERQRGLCAICGGPMSWVNGSSTRATIDHKIPQSRGGGSSMNNLRAACLECNNARGDSWWPGNRPKPKPPQQAAILAEAIRRHRAT